MKPETWISIYAAVVATSAFFLNFRSWYEKGVRLKLSVMPDAMVVGGGSAMDQKNLVALTVMNRGGQVTTLTHCVVLKFDNPWKRLRVKPSSSFIIPNPQIGAGGNIPFELSPGKSWIGAAHKRPDVIADIANGSYYMGVYATNRDRPYLIKIPKPKDKLPAGTKDVGL